ncbi:hypothetical protein SUGI_0546150 [Cryptomeria japonica]|nr:hypothetical protein SUGI_0546150 [Cryptomeria japonica]
MESFKKIPLWVRFPNLPLQYWSESCLEVVGDMLGNILGVDEGIFDLHHTTYAHILVEMDMKRAPLIQLCLQSTNGVSLQPIDYEGIPFRCRHCYQIEHMVANYVKRKCQIRETWWKELNLHLYVVEKSESETLEAMKEKGATDG